MERDVDAVTRLHHEEVGVEGTECAWLAHNPSHTTQTRDQQPLMLPCSIQAPIAGRRPRTLHQRPTTSSPVATSLVSRPGPLPPQAIISNQTSAPPPRGTRPALSLLLPGTKQRLKMSHHVLPGRGVAGPSSPNQRPPLVSTSTVARSACQPAKNPAGRRDGITHRPTQPRGTLLSATTWDITLPQDACSRGLA